MTTNKKVTYKNVAKIGTFITDSTWGTQGETNPAEIYKVGSDYYKKCLPTWLRRGRLQKLDNFDEKTMRSY